MGGRTHSSRCLAISASSTVLLLKSRLAFARASASKLRSLIEKKTPPSSAAISLAHSFAVDEDTYPTSTGLPK